MTDCLNPTSLLINQDKSLWYSSIFITKPGDAQKMKHVRARSLGMLFIYRFTEQWPIDDIICSSIEYRCKFQHTF